MIPKSYIIAWSQKAPWKNNYLVEQDLIIEKALAEFYSNSELNEHLAFRGGTALHKLYFNPQPRYSEDIDLVQISSGPIGDILTLLRERLSFLGEAKYERAAHSNVQVVCSNHIGGSMKSLNYKVLGLFCYCEFRLKFPTKAILVL